MSRTTGHRLLERESQQLKRGLLKGVRSASSQLQPAARHRRARLSSRLLAYDTFTCAG